MSETTVAPVTTETEAPQKGFIGIAVPRKEDKRLVQGEGLFVDDVKRHGMAYVHFVRSPYAHARIASIDVSRAEELDGVYGTLTGDEVATVTDPFFQIAPLPGGHVKDYALAVGKVRHVGEAVVAVAATTRELARDAADLVEVEYEPLEAVVDTERAADPAAPQLHDDVPLNTIWDGHFDYGDFDGALEAADKVVRIKRLHFNRFSSTPLETSGAVVEYNRGTGQWTLHCNNQFPGFAAIMMAPALAYRDRQAALRHAGHRRRLRQQDLHAPAAGRALPALAQAQARLQLDGVAHRPAHGELARQRAGLPGRRGAGHRRRPHARLQGADDRRLRRVHALRAARLHHLVAGHAGRLPLAQRPRRLPAGLLEQVAVRPEPRLLAHAAPVVHRADHGHRRPGAEPRPGRGAQEQLRPRRTRCRTRRRTAASTTRATTRCASTRRSS